MAKRIWLDGCETLDDILDSDLRVLFVGYNPSLYAVEQGHYYARRANRFWEDLYAVGFVDRLLREPGDDESLLRYGLGLTDVVKRPSANIDDISEEEFRQGFERLNGLIESYRPRIVCFNGLGLGKRFSKQGELPPGTRSCSLPSSSPRNRGMRERRLLELQELKRLVDELSSDS